MSASIMARNSSDGPPPGVTAIALSLPFTSGSAITRRSVSSSFFTIGAGVAPGANQPLHNPAHLAPLHQRHGRRAVRDGEQGLTAHHGDERLAAALVGDRLARRAGFQ